MFVRKKKNPSGIVSVQIIEKKDGLKLIVSYSDKRAGKDRRTGKGAYKNWKRRLEQGNSPKPASTTGVITNI